MPWVSVVLAVVLEVTALPDIAAGPARVARLMAVVAVFVLVARTARYEPSPLAPGRDRAIPVA